MVPASTSTRSDKPNHEKRVLPSRSRRGGPGIGSCDADVVILENRKRQSENEPLIPVNTDFLLTTNATLVHPRDQSGTDVEVNTNANLRYFDRPEVLKAYKDQQEIQIPEFVLLSEDAIVGGRFRPRGQEDQEATDTSDVVYEKRHRKYEAFEKRQRLREKEKLKHEHYKLKERIEQLRVMENAAFLVLSPSSFSSPTRVRTDDESASSLHVNGASNHNEGERRREEMLSVALGLEARYRLLLPTGRGTGSEHEKERPSVSRDTSIGSIPAEDEDSEVEEKNHNPPKRKVKEKNKVKIRPPLRDAPSNNSRSGKGVTDERDASPVRSPSSRRSRTTSSPLAFRSFLDPKSGTEAMSPVDTASPSSSDEVNGILNDANSGIPSRPRKRRKHYSEADGEADDDPYFIPPSPVKPTIDEAGKTTCVLLSSAWRSSSTPQARKTKRNVTAFGVKVPVELEEIRDYALPWWIRDDDEQAETLPSD